MQFRTIFAYKYEINRETLGNDLFSYKLHVLKYGFFPRGRICKFYPFLYL